MKRLKFKDITTVLLILLFVYTASNKLFEHDRFMFQMQMSPLPQIVVYAPILSWIVPVIELGIAIILIIGIFKATVINNGLMASLILISIFEIYIAAMLLSGKDLPCACGGIISYMTWKEHLLFNGIIIILIILAFLFNRDLSSKKYSRV